MLVLNVPMTGSKLEVCKVGRGRHLILYDGVCGLCNRGNQFVLRHDRRAVFDFAALQSATARSVLGQFDRDTEALTTFYIVTDYRSESPGLLSKGRAVLFVASTFGGVWFQVFRMLPRGLLDFGYELVARNRYQLFGRMENCILPSVEFRERFLDV